MESNNYKTSLFILEKDISVLQFYADDLKKYIVSTAIFLLDNY